MSSDDGMVSEDLLLRIREALGADINLDALRRRGDADENDDEDDGEEDVEQVEQGGTEEPLNAVDGAPMDSDMSEEISNITGSAITQVENEEGDYVYTVHLHSSHSIELCTAEDDFNKEKKTLFATHIWNGSTVLANYIIDELSGDISNASVVELGAGAGLPSMLCARLGAKFVCCSDYPSPSVMDNIEKNIHRNGLDGGRVIAVPYIWGEDAAGVLAVNGGRQYDVLLASECLWRHEQHRVLAESIARLLRPGGVAAVSYSHHVPGLEAEDDAFFALAESEECGLRVRRREAVRNKHMWQKERDVDIYVVELTKL